MKRLLSALGLIIILTISVTACGADKKSKYKPEGADAKEPTLSKEASKLYQYAYPVEGDLCADIEVLNYGHIYIKLFKEEAPYAVDNFVAKVKAGDYNGTSVSKAVTDYYVQMGKPLNNLSNEESKWGGGFSNEISSKLLPTRGSVCMANQGNDSSNAMQFFINTTEASTIKSLNDPLTSRYGLSLKEYIKNSYDIELTKSQINSFTNYGGAPWLTGRNTVFAQVFKGFDVLDKLEEGATSEETTLYISKITVYDYID